MSQQHWVFFSISVQLCQFRYGGKWRQLHLNKVFAKGQNKQNGERSKYTEGVGKVVVLMTNL